jgi:hypothetical protein
MFSLLNNPRGLCSDLTDPIRQWPSQSTPWVELIYHRHRGYTRYPATPKVSIRIW